MPLLLLPLISPAVGQHYGLGDALVHGVCFFVAGGGALQRRRSAVDGVRTIMWRPLADCLRLSRPRSRIAEPFFGELSRYSLFGIMDGEIYFRGGGVPWLELLASAAVSAALLFAASRNLARQDF